MIRLLTILAAVVALAVSAGPAAASTQGDDAPVESISLFKASPPKPPRLATRNGGEVISADAYAKAPRGIVVTKATDVSSTN